MVVYPPVFFSFRVVKIAEFCAGRQVRDEKIAVVLIVGGRNKFPQSLSASAREGERSVNFSEFLYRGRRNAIAGLRRVRAFLIHHAASGPRTDRCVRSRACVWKKTRIPRVTLRRTVFAGTILADWKLKFHAAPHGSSHHPPSERRKPFLFKRASGQAEMLRYCITRVPQHRFLEPRAEMAGSR